DGSRSGRRAARRRGRSSRARRCPGAAAGRGRRRRGRTATARRDADAAGLPSMSALVDLVLGVVTSIGGFVEAGSISTAAQAGSEFHYQLLWAIAAATIILAMLVEMSGRLAAISKQSLAAAVRERFGMPFQFVPLAAELAIDILLLAAEMG